MCDDIAVIVMMLMGIPTKTFYRNVSEDTSLFSNNHESQLPSLMN